MMHLEDIERIARRVCIYRVREICTKEPCETNRINLLLLPYHSIHQVRPHRQLNPRVHIFARMQQVPMLKDQYPSNLRLNIKLRPLIARMKCCRPTLQLPFWRIRIRLIEVEMQRIKRELIPTRYPKTPIPVRPEIIPLLIPQEPHPLIQSRHLEHLLPFPGPHARDQRLLVDGMYLRH